MNVTLLVVLFFVAAITLGLLLIIFGYLHLRRRSFNNRELQELRNAIMEIKSDIEDIKEQIADFIIKTS
jgi:cell division protein FtsL